MTIFALDGCPSCGRVACDRPHTPVQRRHAVAEDFPRGSVVRLRYRVARIATKAAARGDFLTLERASEFLALVDDYIQSTAR